MFRPAKTEATVSHHQNSNVKEVGTPPGQSNFCTSPIAVSTAVRNKVTQTVSKKQLLRSNSAARESIQLREPSSTSLLLTSDSVQKATVEEQLSKQENPSSYASPAPPPSSSSLLGSGEKDDEGILLPSWCVTSGEGGGRGRQAKSYLKYISHDAEGCVRVSQTRSKLDLICPQKVQ